MYTPVAAVPEAGAAEPSLISVSLRPSLLFQPAGHLLRSIVNPSGPRTVLPSGWRPQWFDLILATIASRSVFQSASHWSMVVGCWAADVGGATPAFTADSTLLSMRFPPPAVLFELSSPPQPTAETMPSPISAAVVARRTRFMVGPSLSAGVPPRARPSPVI